jgi:hypothetical protein
MPKIIKIIRTGVWDVGLKQIDNDLRFNTILKMGDVAMDSPDVSMESIISCIFYVYLL